MSVTTRSPISGAMAQLLRTLGTAGIVAGVLWMAASTPRAAEAVHAIPERRAVATYLGSDSSALTYWASEGGSMHVVTTIDTVTHQDEPEERHAVVRFASDLLPGQSQLISVPVAIGERQQVLRIRRLGDQIEVARIPAPAV